MKRPALSPSLLFTLLAGLLLAAADLALVGHVAGAEDPESAAEPSELPDAAFLTGRDAPSTTVQGILARVEETKEAFLLRLTNAGEETRKVDLEAICYQRVGSPMSRMGVQRQEMAADRIVATLAPGQTRVQALGCAPRAAGGPAGGLGDLGDLGGLGGGFSTTDFEFYPGGTPPQARRSGSFGMIAPPPGPRPARQAGPTEAPERVEPLARLRVSQKLGEKVAAAPAEVPQQG